MTFDPWDSIRKHEADYRQHSENSARLAQAYGFSTTTGWGEFTFEDCHLFGLTFIEEPSVAYGYSMNGDDLVDLRFPRAWGFVYKWKQDVRGYYVGAWVAAVIDTLSPATIDGVPADDPGYSLDHSFTYTGLALKDLPVDVLDYPGA